jgi:high-affinity nickel-transport protein
LPDRDNTEYISTRHYDRLDIGNRESIRRHDCKTLVNTTDGILMVGADGWAFMKPIRKLYYNLTITFASVIVALMVGGIKGVGLLEDQLNLTGGFWDFIGSLNDNFGTLVWVL